MDELQQQVEGLMDSEDQIVNEMLGLGAPPPPPPAPKAAVEVIQPTKPTKLLVSIPPDAPNQATVTRVEVMEDGNFRVLEQARAPTPAERALILHGKKEVLSAPAPAPVGAAEEKKDEGRPWWQWAIGVAVVGGAGLWAAKTYAPQFFASKSNGLEEDAPEELEEVEEELEEEE